jgi:hypothetical protein
MTDESDFKIYAYNAADDATVAANVASARARGLPKLQFGAPPHRGKCAIAGGGPSIRETWPELLGYDLILSINATRPWLEVEHGIQTTMIVIDPLPVIAKFVHGATSALIATRCAPEVFDAARLTQVRTFEAPGDVTLRSCTASTAIELAWRLGFRNIALYGCESSYKGGRSHAYRHEDRDTIVVRAGGKDYVTAPDYWMQAKEIADTIRMAPGCIKERGGGLLRAMIHDKDAKPVRLIKAEPLAA